VPGCQSNHRVFNEEISNGATLLRFVQEGDEMKTCKILLSILIFAAVGISADAQVIYSSIPSPLPPNVDSRGPEAYAFSEIGDGLIFKPGSARLATTVKVILSDFACTSGHWNSVYGTADACVTTPGATFSQPVTLNIYAVNPTTPPSAGTLLATQTATFNVPYRPSSSATCYDRGSGTAWYNAPDDTCYHGIAFPIVFDITSLNVQLPDQVVVGISYNTTHFGPNPIGEATACFTTDNNCPYDSLNVSTQGSPTVGSDIDPNSIFFNYVLSANSCSGTAPTGIMEEDPGECFGGEHPEIEVDTTPADSFLIHYASNLNIGDSVVNLTNAGTLSGTDPAGRICVNVYTFDPAEEMVSCCSCMVTPNGLNSLSTVSDLISNPLTLGVPTSVVIKLTATAPVAGMCNAAASGDFVPGLRAWGSTLHQNTVTGGYNVTESPFARAVLSGSEISKDLSMCNFIQTNGSGYGICKSCQNAGLSVSKR
jgi:hypothetical protein